MSDRAVEILIGAAFIAVGVLAIAALAAWWRRDDRNHRDPFDHYGITINAAEAEGFGDLGPMPPEIAHEWPKTSPAAPSFPPSAPAREAGPATAAAADPDAPPPSPPPLPGQLAPADIDRVPFRMWEDDAFVEAVTAIRDHGDWDAPASAPREWHAELEDV